MPKRIALISKACVACGNCVNECPKEAIIVYKGLYAAADQNRCVGCGRCAIVCPAGIISIIQREGESGE